MSYCFKIFFVCCITVGIIVSKVSSEINISGKVMDLSDKPVSGATVKVKAAGKSTITDKDGNFSIPTKTGTIASFDLEAVQPDFAFLSRGKIEIRTSNRILASITGFNPGGRAVFK